LAAWEDVIAGDYLTGALCAVDFTLYPYVALVERVGRRKPDAAGGEVAGPKMKAWMERMQALPIMRKTWPPHWK
jgi:glutathione S-transferase